MIVQFWEGILYLEKAVLECGLDRGGIGATLCKLSLEVTRVGLHIHCSKIRQSMSGSRHLILYTGLLGYGEQVGGTGGGGWADEEWMKIPQPVKGRADCVSASLPVKALCSFPVFS